MTRRQLIFASAVVYLVGTSLTASAQNAEPISVEGAREVLQKFLELNKSHQLSSSEAKALLTGEALERWVAPYWGVLSDSPDRVELLGENKAIGRVQWHGANEQVTDFYFYLTFDGSWKLEAMRHLALTGVVEMVYIALKDVKNPTEEQLYQLQNARLVLASDAKLREWFKDNQAGLNGMIQLLESSKECSTGFHAKTKCSPDVQNAMRTLYIGSVSKEKDGDVWIAMGGITDNEVGFLYSPRNRQPPIDQSAFIWVERVAECWFLYRTT